MPSWPSGCAREVWDGLGLGALGGLSYEIPRKTNANI